MFTGIITGQGLVLSENPSHLKLRVPADFNDAVLGESIAINGVCLTVTAIQENTLEFYVSPETLLRSNLGTLALESRVNLERALRLGDRLSGHIVQGHVDTQARIQSIKKSGESHELVITLPKDDARFVVEKGSIAIDGISLTINSIDNSNIYLMIIPHTWGETGLSTRAVGDSVNIEYDMVLKHITRLSHFEKR
jgi:riboflavin synthase